MHAHINIHQCVLQSSILGISIMVKYGNIKQDMKLRRHYTDRRYTGQANVRSGLEITVLYICILSHIAISLSLSLFLSVFCAACQCFKTLFSVLNTCHF
jgi:hypothetical protein